MSQVRNFSRLPDPSEHRPLSLVSFLDGSLQQSGHFRSQSLTGENTTGLLSLSGLTSALEISWLSSGNTCLLLSLLGPQLPTHQMGAPALLVHFVRWEYWMLYTPVSCDIPSSPVPSCQGPVFQVPGPNSNSGGHSPHNTKLFSTLTG